MQKIKEKKLTPQEAFIVKFAPVYSKKGKLNIKKVKGLYVDRRK